jgi:hypothetical protein
MRALAEQGVPILGFEPIKQDLEGAFWDLAASLTPAAGAQSRRAA